MLFSPSLLASELEKHFPDILFAFLFGSSQQGEVRQGGEQLAFEALSGTRLFVREEALDIQAIRESHTHAE